MTAQTVLVVEDEIKIANIVQEYLEDSGFKVKVIDNGLDVVDWVKKHSVDLVLLDVMLPGKDGLQICKEVRAFSQVPIIMLTAKVEEIDRILGLELGADDYVCKPFSPRELLARVKALLRRSANHNEHLNDDIWQMDEERYQVRYQGKTVGLSLVEFAILKLLSESPGRIYSRTQLIGSIYPDNRVVSDRTVDSHIKKLRHKLAEELTDKELIHSVYGVGYKFEMLA
ncbi:MULTISPECIES: response regulator [Piscirickettsiaceae]|jgi:two-component system response regulator BaeR|uniref:Response regulator n=1 Tax=Hydrogenovibrio thermophilus TaxID=265883 RepID=A0A410H2L7_9GAMM|nr:MULTISPECIES: response regulator [Piscirickettsiaceae]AZR82302.1 two-component system response regulator [Thiomicrospira sp. S5]QAB15157.1 response regulator [Hydrogenovibrio thermophilus]